MVDPIWGPIYDAVESAIRAHLADELSGDIPDEWEELRISVQHEVKLFCGMGAHTQNRVKVDVLVLHFREDGHRVTAHGEWRQFELEILEMGTGNHLGAFDELVAVVANDPTQS